LDIILISSDGTPDLQNYYRPFKGGNNSSDILEKNIKYLSSEGKGVTGIRMTITRESYDKQITNIDYFSALGIRNFWVDPIFPSVGAIEPIEKLNMVEFTRCYIEAVKYAYAKGLTYGSILTCNFDHPGEYACRALLPVPL
jgi:sulfatase maturation enzyme AslB (radical SAM superfamily)